MSLKDKIIAAYWDSRLLHNKIPVTEYALCKELGITENEFFEHFPNLGSIEQSFWKGTIMETLAVLEQDEDYETYDFQQKLLAFFFTYFAHIQQYRSRFLHCFPGLSNFKALSPMRDAVRQHMKTLVHQGIAEDAIADRKKLSDLYDRGLFEHLRMLIEYYKRDTSEQFQDTDALIEKSVKLFIESARAGVFESAYDLVRFMLRKATPNK